MTGKKLINMFFEENSGRILVVIEYGAIDKKAKMVKEGEKRIEEHGTLKWRGVGGGKPYGKTQIFKILDEVSPFFQAILEQLLGTEGYENGINMKAHMAKINYQKSRKDAKMWQSQNLSLSQSLS